jgi:uncharacterized protein (TIGR04551 family)
VTRRALAAATLLGATALLAPRPARATGFTDIGEDIKAQTETTVKVSGTFRIRGEALYDLDLDRGPTPSGQFLFPLPLSNPTSHLIEAADLRLRADIGFYAPFASVAVKMRVDAPNNLVLGGTPQGIPGGSATQLPATAMTIRRVYGEALTPIGVIAAGRMGSHWGLGILTNGGDCVDCDSGDAADRIAFITPIGGFIWAASFDFSATGPQRTGSDGNHVINVDPTTDVRTVTLAFLRWKDDRALERRRKAGKGTFDLGAYFSYRWQQNDVPATYLPLANPVPINSAQVMYRGYTAMAFDGWTRITLPKGHIEAEAAILSATVAQPSLIPGVLLNNSPVHALQVGAALESEFGAPEDIVTGGLDAGYASGDPRPGFGVNQPLTAPPPVPGDLNGPHADPPFYDRADYFRFHSDYRIDRILFREIIGTVTDAVYIRPHMRWNIVRLGPSALTASLTCIASFAAFAASTPNQKAPLGIEVDPTLSYGAKDGFGAAIEHAVLFPLAGLDNTALRLKAQPAQLIRLRLTYSF